VPFSLASFTIDNSCAPAAAVPGAVGDTYLTTFPALGAIVSTLSAGRLASMNCATDQTLIATAAAPAAPSVSAGATVNPTEYAAINAAVAANNTKIAAIATANNWALVDFNAALTAQAALIPPIASFSTPTNLFGTLFSQDGVHPSGAGQKIIANTFIAAINAKYGTSLAVIP
jgi:lysophospholipase L1-like esterase